MPSQQRFEGADLEVLLDDVRGRFGPDVTIVEANKIRKGGVGGFFARELFEVVVEVEDAADALAAPSGPVRPRTLLELVDAVDDGPAPEPPADEGIATLLARVAQTRAEATAPLTAPPTSMSTDGDAFATVLDRIARATAEPEPATADDEPFRSFADTEPSLVPAATGTPVVAPAPVLPAARRRRVPATPSPATPVDPVALERLGLPSSLVRAAVTGAGHPGALLELAERFPRADPLPGTGDTVIALVGDRRGMERAVTWVHEQLGLAPDRLMLASPTERGAFPTARRITDEHDAASRRRSWRRTTRPTLVVVDEPVGIRGTGWARQVLDALEPAAVWAVVDAERKPEDVAAWAEHIGGVDAIALDGTAATSTPAAILSTGLPVGLVDGHSATPARWAAILDERLQAA